MGIRCKPTRTFLTTEEMTRWLCVHLLSRGVMAVPKYYIGEWECDVLAYDKKGVVTEYKIKISRSDFQHDAKKVATDRHGNVLQTKEQSLLSGERVNKFVYVCPKEMIDKSELPPYAGLMEVDAIKYEDGEVWRRLYISVIPKWLNREPLLPKMERQLLFKLPYKLCSKKYGFNEETTD